MAQHPLNLAVRFLLELTALAALGYGGWHRGQGAMKTVLAILLPLLAAALWGVFRVPGDPGPAPVAVPGIVRLLLEAAFFGAAVWILSPIAPKVAGAFGLAVILHYALSCDRILWLLKR